jgi:hypothetical protein
MAVAMMLWYASQDHQVDVVEAVVAKIQHADLDRRHDVLEWTHPDHDAFSGNTSLFNAIFDDDHEIVELLLAARADVTKVTGRRDGWNAMHEVCYFTESTKCLQLLLQHEKAPVLIKEKSTGSHGTEIPAGSTPMDVARIGGRRSHVQMLSDRPEARIGRSGSRKRKHE